MPGSTWLRAGRLRSGCSQRVPGGCALHTGTAEEPLALPLPPQGTLFLKWPVPLQALIARANSSESSWREGHAYMGLHLRVLCERHGLVWLLSPRPWESSETLVS